MPKEKNVLLIARVNKVVYKFLPLIIICLLIANAVCAQHNDKDSLKGKISLTIDISQMKDTAGRFKVMLGGKILYPKVEKNTIRINEYMQEPRWSVLAFYPIDSIKKYPGKELYMIAAGIKNDYQFFAQPGNFKIVVGDSVANSQILNPTIYQKDFDSLQKLENDFEKNQWMPYQDLVTEYLHSSGATRDSLQKILSKKINYNDSLCFITSIAPYIQSHPNSPVSVYQLEAYTHKNYNIAKTLLLLYNNLTDRMKSLPAAKRAFGDISQNDFFAKSLFGKPAMDFTQPDTSGKNISLSNFQGKVVLLDFWASWCGPCRAANPGLLKIWNKYKNKGFQIVSVSLDDNKKNWIKAIREDNIGWVNISDLKGGGNGAGSLYHINMLPTNFLIDRAGIIIANNIEGEDLEKEIDKLLTSN